MCLGNICRKYIYSFIKVGLDLTVDVFAHGQLYSAMSRVRSWDNLYFCLPETSKNRKVKNIVFKEILTT